MNTLNIPIKRKMLLEWVEKLDSAIYMLSVRDTLDYNTPIVCQ